MKKFIVSTVVSKRREEKAALLTLRLVICGLQIMRRELEESGPDATPQLHSGRMVHLNSSRGFY